MSICLCACVCVCVCVPPTQQVNEFDQALINQGRVHYVEVGTNVTSDHFVFDVTNGISSLSRLVFNIQVCFQEGYG